MDPVPIWFQGEIREFLTRVYKLIIIIIITNAEKGCLQRIKYIKCNKSKEEFKYEPGCSESTPQMLRNC